MSLTSLIILALALVLFIAIALIRDARARSGQPGPRRNWLQSGSCDSSWVGDDGGYADGSSGAHHGHNHGHAEGGHSWGDSDDGHAGADSSDARRENREPRRANPARALASGAEIVRRL